MILVVRNSITEEVVRPGTPLYYTSSTLTVQRTRSSFGKPKFVISKTSINNYFVSERIGLTTSYVRTLTHPQTYLTFHRSLHTNSYTYTVINKLCISSCTQISNTHTYVQNHKNQVWVVYHFFLSKGDDDRMEDKLHLCVSRSRTQGERRIGGRVEIRGAEEKKDRRRWEKGLTRTPPMTKTDGPC